MVQQRLRDRRPHNDAPAVLPARGTPVAHLPVPHQLQFRRDVFKHFPHQFFPDALYPAPAARTRAFFLVQVVYAVLRVGGICQLPLAGLVHPVHAAPVLLEWLRRFLAVLLFRLREQTQRVFFLRRRRLAGAAKLLFAQKCNDFVQIPYFLQQGLNGAAQLADVFFFVLLRDWLLAQQLGKAGFHLLHGALPRNFCSHDTAKRPVCRAVCAENSRGRFCVECCKNQPGFC